ncbi:MAG: hypothetical protein HQK51_08360 [Oligoflexia bacterium]|nr:hypothetical protein [Oligoflexia bacterium]
MLNLKRKFFLFFAYVVNALGVCLIIPLLSVAADNNQDGQIEIYQPLTEYEKNILEQAVEDNQKSMFQNKMAFFFEIPYFEVALTLTNFTPIRERKAFKAAEIIQQVLNSKEFKEQLINFTYNNEKQFANNEDLTNEEIYEKIISGEEVLISGLNYQMDLVVSSYYKKFTSTVGYTYPNINKIYVNAKFYDHYNPAQIAGNFVHEWCHKLGFIHDYNRTARRAYSVPYAVGYIVEKLGEKYLDNLDREEEFN